MPSRVKLSRAAGWRKPDGVVVVSRPSRWGNPYAVGDVLHGAVLTAQDAVDLYEADLRAGRLARFTYSDVLEHLAGVDLACWCSLDAPCHADVLLRIANC